VEEPNEGGSVPAAVLTNEATGTPAKQRLADARLLERIRSGDEIALAELYDGYGGQAFGLAYTILKDRGAAEDAVQDAFVTLWKKAPRLDPARGRVTSLLMTIVHHRAVDLSRRRSGHVARSVELDAVDVACDRAAAIDLVVGEESRIAVRRAIDLLPHYQRRTVQLAYFEGRTHVEIAQIMNVPDGTVKSRLRLALEKMRVTLHPELAC
jgi:RNA polymerase sigma-70 factor (ECF subfamily)